MRGVHLALVHEDVAAERGLRSLAHDKTEALGVVVALDDPPVRSGADLCQRVLTERVHLVRLTDHVGLGKLLCTEDVSSSVWMKVDLVDVLCRNFLVRHDFGRKVSVFERLADIRLAGMAIR